MSCFGTGPVSWRPFAVSLSPALPVAVWFLHRGYRLRQDQVDAASIATPFE